MKKKYLTEVVLLTKSYNLQDFKDWLKWHLEIVGFDHCHVFDNESSVDIKSVCDSYKDKISYEKIIGWPDQYSLYNRYINNESKAWWVLPIDDDEFLYVSDKYKNNIKNVILDVSKSQKDRCKICVGWRNLFPEKYIENRQNEHLILNAFGWSDKISEIWQAGNRPVKTIVKTTKKFEWSDRIGHSTHDPLVNGEYNPGKTIDDKEVKNSWQLTPTDEKSDLILYHYQYKSNSEWIAKCSKGSPANKKFSEIKKNKTDIYKKIYETKEVIYIDKKMSILWTGRNIVNHISQK